MLLPISSSIRGTGTDSGATGPFDTSRDPLGAVVSQPAWSETRRGFVRLSALSIAGFGLRHWLRRYPLVPRWVAAFLERAEPLQLLWPPPRPPRPPTTASSTSSNAARADTRPTNSHTPVLASNSNCPRSTSTRSWPNLATPIGSPPRSHHCATGGDSIPTTLLPSATDGAPRVA